MPPTSLEKIIPVLQVAISPVILISGVGLLLLTMTNRLGRVIDRVRQLNRVLSEHGDEPHEQTLAQVAILYRRARMPRLGACLKIERGPATEDFRSSRGGSDEHTRSGL